MSKAQRRQRDDEDNGTTPSSSENHNQEKESSSSSIFKCDNDIVYAVKNQMTLMGQNRSDVVDVHNNELGVRECHVIAALLGLNQAPDCRAMKEPSNAEKKKMKKELRQEHDKDKTEDVTAQLPSLIPIPPFFNSVHTMRLQLGASVLPSVDCNIVKKTQNDTTTATTTTTNKKEKTSQNESKKNTQTTTKTNLNNLQCEGGFDVILSAIEQFHAPSLRRLDLSKNRFFTRHTSSAAASKNRIKEMELFSRTILSCQNLNLLCLSHNVNLRSDGAIVVATACTRLPHLRALLMQRCSIDDRGAVEIARLFAEGKLPNVSALLNNNQSENNSKNNDDDNDGNHHHRINNNSNNTKSVLLTLDLSMNRISPVGIHALRRAIPDSVGLGMEKQSPPVVRQEKKQEGNNNNRKEKK